MTEISRRGFLKAAGATLSAVASLEFQPTKKVEAAKPPSHPEWALGGDYLGSFDFNGISTNVSLTPKGKNRVTTLETSTEAQRLRYLSNNQLPNDTTRIQELIEGNKGILVVKSEDETGPHFLVRREKEKMEVTPAYGGSQITEVLALDPYQLAVLESGSIKDGSEQYVLFRRLIRRGKGHWENLSAANGNPYLKDFWVTPPWAGGAQETQKITLALENGILKLTRKLWQPDLEHEPNGLITDPRTQTYFGPELRLSPFYSSSQYRQANGEKWGWNYHGADSLTFPLDFDHLASYTRNYPSGSYFLDIIETKRNTNKPVSEWGGIGIEGAQPVSARVNVYDKSRQNALTALTYVDHEGKRSYALFHLNWETPFVTAFNHKITGHALGYLTAGEQITGFKGVNFFDDGAMEVKVITNQERTYEDSKILLQP